MARKRHKKAAHPSGRPPAEAVHGKDRFSPPRQVLKRVLPRLPGHGMR